jgi:PAS domain S-box-containing protein
VTQRSSISVEQWAGLLVAATREYAIYLLDPEGCVASWNPGAERITGYSAEEVLGRHFSVLYPEEDQAAGRPAQALREAAESGSYSERGWRVRADGSRFWAAVTVTAITDEAGVLLGFAKIIRDETDRRELELQARRIEELDLLNRISDELRASIVRRVFDAGLALQSTLRLVEDPTVRIRLEEVLIQMDEAIKEVRSAVVSIQAEAQADTPGAKPPQSARE